MNWNSETTRLIRSPKVMPVAKPLPFGLTEDEKEQLIKAFVEVIERPSTQEEICELFSEELKLKRGSRK